MTTTLQPHLDSRAVAALREVLEIALVPEDSPVLEELHELVGV